MLASRFSRALPRATTTAAQWAKPLRKPLGSTFARYESTEGKVQGAVIGIDLGKFKNAKNATNAPAPSDIHPQ